MIPSGGPAVRVMMNFKTAFAARFLKCVWPFWDIMHERVKLFLANFFNDFLSYTYNALSRCQWRHSNVLHSYNLVESERKSQ